MSISSINAAFASQLGVEGTLIGSSLHYIDGGRLQLIATTLMDAAGKRQTIIRPFTGSIDVAASAKQMALDWQAGALAPIATDGQLTPEVVPVTPAPVSIAAVSSAPAGAPTQ